MIDIQEITSKIIEEKENMVARAFTMRIGELLKENGIVPVMTEYTKQDIDNVTDPSEYKLVTEFGVAFSELDTSEHDKKVRSDAIDKFIDKFIKINQFKQMNKGDCITAMYVLAEALKENNNDT